MDANQRNAMIKKATKKKYWKRVVTIEVLTKGEPIGELELDNLVHEIIYGAASGKVTYADPVELTVDEMQEALINQDSDPSFLLGD